MKGWIVIKEADNRPKVLLGTFCDIELEDLVFEGVIFFVYKKDAEKFAQKGQIIIRARIVYER